MLLFFLSAGTWKYWQGWMYIGTLYVPMLFILAYLLDRDPELLERRTHMREERKKQRTIVKVSAFFMIFAYLLPGFDIRYGWSNMPAAVSIAAAAVVFMGYMIVFRTMKINSFLSRVIEVADGQRVVDTDLYGVVRHPMYIGVVLMYAASPIALGSWWGAIPGLMIVPVIVMRILDEEIALEKDLAGYKEYKQKVKYRLIPFVW